MKPIMVKTVQIPEWSNEFWLIHPDAVRSMEFLMRSTGQLQTLVLQKTTRDITLLMGKSDTMPRWHLDCRSCNR